MDTLRTIAQVAGNISAILALAALLIKPIRNKLFTRSDERKGIRCLLRAQMLNIYYKHVETKTIRQHEKELFGFCYKAYKAMNGNSFIDDIHAEVRTWEVRS